MFDIALGIFLLLSPIFLLPSVPGSINALQFYQFGVLGNAGYNYLQLQFFCFGIIVLFVVSMLSKPRREFKETWVIVLLAMFLFSVYIHPLGIKMITPVFLGFILFYLVVVFSRDHKFLLMAILCVSSLNTIFALMQSAGIHLIYPENGRIDGLMCLSTHLGTYQAIALPVCFSINPFLAVIPIIGIILSKSITAILIMLGWIAIKVFSGIRIKRKILNIASLPLLMALLSLAALFILYNRELIMQKLNIRLAVWIPTIKDISHNLIFGTGLKNFKFISPAGLYENPCSAYLGLIRWLGVLAIIPVAMIIRKVISLRNFVLAESVLIALLIGIEKPIFDYPRIAGTVIVLFGLLIASKRKEILCE